MPSQKTLDEFEERHEVVKSGDSISFGVSAFGGERVFTAGDVHIPHSEWHPTIGQPEAANSESDKLDALYIKVGPRYRTLRAILDAAFAHAATGKGKERHARDLPFDEQPMLVTTRMVGPGFPLGQAIKKSQEAAGMIERGQYDAAEAECLGAINYLAGAVAWVREQRGTGYVPPSTVNITAAA